MNYRKIMLVAFLLLAIVTLGSVSATHDADALTIVDDDGDGIAEAPSNDEILSDSSDDSDDGLDDPEDGEPDDGELDDGELDDGEPEVWDGEPIDPNMTVDNLSTWEIMYDEWYYIGVELPEDARGIVTLYIDDEVYRTVDLDELDEYESFDGFGYAFEKFGTTEFKVTYSGDEKYLPASESFEYFLNNTCYHIGIENGEYGSGRIYLNPPLNFNGDIYVTYKGKKYKVVEDQDVDSADTRKYVNASIFAYGENNVTVSSDGDDNFGKFNKQGRIEIYSSIHFKDSIYYGDSEDVISLTLPKDATGTLTIYESFVAGYDEEMMEDIYESRVIATKNIKNGYAGISFSNMSVGYYELEGVYEGNYGEIREYGDVHVNPIITIPKTVIKGETAEITIEGSPDMDGDLIVYYYIINDYEDEQDLQKVGSSKVVNGFANVTMPDLELGEYRFRAYYPNDEYLEEYAGSQTVYYVNDTDFEIEFEYYPNNILFNDSYSYVEFKLPEYATGNVSLYIDDKFIEKTVIEYEYYYRNYFYLNTSDLDFGTHTLTLEYVSDEYSNSNATGEFKVVSAYAGIPQEILYNAYEDWASYRAIHVYFNEDATGTVTILFNGSEYSKNVLTGDSEGLAVRIAGVPVGVYNVTVLYSGDDKYPEATSSGILNLSYYMAIYYEDIEYSDKDDYYVEVNVPNDIRSNNFAITIDGKNYDFTKLDNHYLRVNVSGLGYGDHPMVVKYLGDDFYSAKEINGTIHVRSEVQVRYDWRSGYYIKLALPNDATGKLAINITKYDHDDDEGCEIYVPFDYKEIALKDGVAFYSLEDFAMGRYHVNCSYVGGNYNVEDYETSLYVRADIHWSGKLYEEDSLTYGQTDAYCIDTAGWEGDFVVTLEKIVGRYFDEEEWEWVYTTENIANKTIPLVNGKASYTLPILKLGLYRISGRYVIDGIEYESEGSTFGITPIELNVPEEININDPEAISAVMPKDTVGSLIVDLYVVNDDDDGDYWQYYGQYSAAFKDGAAVVKLQNLPNVEYYRFDVNCTTENYGSYFQNYNHIMVFNGTKVAPTIIISPGETYEGENLIVGVNIADATGNVVVNGVTYTLNYGRATATINNVSAGDLTITVTYPGDVKYLEGTNSTKATVKAKEDAGLKVTVSDIEIGQNATVNIEIAEDAIGKVTIDGNEIAIENGKGTYTITDLKAGKYTVTAVFTGDRRFKADEKTASFNVNKLAPSIQITTGEAVEGSDLTVNVTVNGATGTVSVNGQSATLADGKATVTIKDVSVGTMDVTAVYSGDDLYDSAEKTVSVQVTTDPKITAKDTSVLYTAKGKYTVTVYGTDGKVAANTEVVFTIAGKQVGKVKTNSKGQASYTVTKTPGTYKITATALGKSVTKKLTVKHVATLKTMTVKRSAKSLTLQVTLSKVNGKYLKNKAITFKFNGKTYKKVNGKAIKTNAKGVAKLTIKASELKKLKAGKTVAYQATYLKDTVKKTAKVKK